MKRLDHTFFSSGAFLSVLKVTVQSFTCYTCLPTKEGVDAKEALTVRYLHPPTTPPHPVLQSRL